MARRETNDIFLQDEYALLGKPIQAQIEDTIDTVKEWIVQHHRALLVGVGFLGLAFMPR